MVNTMDGYIRGQAARGNPLRVFDWDKAARLIRDRHPTYARAGLSMDWEWTGDTIYEDGKPVKDCETYLASNWATPEIELDGDVEDCYVLEHETQWRSDTKWPESALAILTAAVRESDEED